MAALRRLQSSGAVPSGAMARHGAFIALGAVGISLGAAWAWSQARKRRAPEVEIEPLACLSKLAGCGASPRRRGGKRHKTRITAAQRYSSHAAAEYSDSGAVVAVHMHDSMSPVQGEIMDLSSDVEDVIADTMENEPAAEYAIIEVAPEVDIKMAEERTTLPPKQAEEAEGAWIAGASCSSLPDPLTSPREPVRVIRIPSASLMRAVHNYRSRAAAATADTLFATSVFGC